MSRSFSLYSKDLNDFLLIARAAINPNDLFSQKRMIQALPLFNEIISEDKVVSIYTKILQT